MSFKMVIIGQTLYGKEESDALDKHQLVNTGKKETKKEGEVVELTKFVFKD